MVSICLSVYIKVTTFIISYNILIIESSIDMTTEFDLLTTLQNYDDFDKAALNDNTLLHSPAFICKVASLNNESIWKKFITSFNYKCTFVQIAHPMADKYRRWLCSLSNDMKLYVLRVLACIGSSDDFSSYFKSVYCDKSMWKDGVKDDLHDLADLAIDVDNLNNLMIILDIEKSNEMFMYCMEVALEMRSSACVNYMVCILEDKFIPSERFFKLLFQYGNSGITATALYNLDIQRDYIGVGESSFDKVMAIVSDEFKYILLLYLYPINSVYDVYKRVYLNIIEDGKRAGYEYEDDDMREGSGEDDDIREGSDEDDDMRVGSDEDDDMRVGSDKDKVIYFDHLRHISSACIDVLETHKNLPHHLMSLHRGGKTSILLPRCIILNILLSSMSTNMMSNTMDTLQQFNEINVNEYKDYIELSDVNLEGLLYLWSNTIYLTSTHNGTCTLKWSVVAMGDIGENTFSIYSVNT